MKFANLFYYLVYFCYYLWVPLHFLILFMDLIVLFQLTFYLYLQYFQQKIFSFNKISGSQTDLASVWIEIKNENYFTIKIIFATIHGSHRTHEPYYTILTNFYLY